MSKNDRNYTKLDAEKFVKQLGCWTFVNPTDAVKRRDKNEYLALLEKLIAVNKTRHDMIGSWEIQAAYQILTTLKP
jgi:hypothetical protein